MKKYEEEDELTKKEKRKNIILNVPGNFKKEKENTSRERERERRDKVSSTIKCFMWVREEKVRKKEKIILICVWKGEK